MDKEEIRKKFIDAAITIGAKQGVDAITMRSMSKHAGINTAYMYRCFDDVYEVQLQAFLLVNKLFVSNLLKHIQIFDDGQISKEKELQFFKNIWLDMKQDVDKYEFFLRYYYNYVFPKDYASEESRKDLQPLLQKIKPLFKEGTNLVRIMLHLMDNLVKFAIALNEDNSTEKKDIDLEVYKFLYATVVLHLKNSIIETENEINI